MNREDIIIGIDLGTTNSCVAIVEAGRPKVIPNRMGHHTTPSIVAFTPKGRRLVGQLAKRQAVVNAENTIFAAKRLIGRRWSSKEREQFQQYLPYKLKEGPHDDIRISCFGEEYSPAEVSSVVLSEMKMLAEEYLGHQIQYAVITVPAYFHDAQRQATKDAGRMAGLEVLRVINEPTAAALAYGIGKSEQRRIAVYDLGGGTFDISVLELQDGVFEVISTAGDTFLGGEDFDQRVIEWLVFGFAKEHNIDLRGDVMTYQRLKEAAEKARWELSSQHDTDINLPFLYTDDSGNTYHLERKLTREKLEALTDDLIERTIEICRSTMEHACMKVQELNDILLVGGMTRMPKIQEVVSKFFGRKPNKKINPDESVALGAAIQGETLRSEQSDVLLLDVTPHSLGIMIAGGFYQVLIEKNTMVPCSRSHIFTTVKDYQTQVRIVILQGESSQAEENELLGEVLLDGLTPAPRGEVEVEVTFAISADGLVSVSAKDLDTGQEQSIQVTATSHLTEEEMKRMIEENIDYTLATKTSEEFEKQRQLAELDMQKINDLLPQVEEIVHNSAFGGDALQKARDVLKRTQKAIDEEQLTDLISHLPTLQRTCKIFRQIVDHQTKRV
jgi:molecular chaperone DnaK